MIAVAVVGLACFAEDRVFVGYVTQCYGGRMVPTEFVVFDAATGSPVPGAKLTLSGRGTHHHDVETGPDGRAFLAFQPGCEVRIYLLRGLVYTVYYSNWELGIEAGGYDPVREKLSSYRADTSYPHDSVPPPIVIQIKRR
jgi:hypothetical protein